METPCGMLRRYSTAGEATRTVAILKLAHGGRERFAPYGCAECGGWHLSATGRDPEHAGGASPPRLFLTTPAT